MNPCNMRTMRQLKGLTQLELAFLTGMTQGAISELEAGKINRCEIPTALKIARSLDCQIEDLLDSTGEVEK